MGSDEPQAPQAETKDHAPRVLLGQVAGQRRIALAGQRQACEVVPVDPDTCHHVWILDKTSEVVRLICAKCGKVMNP